jgi:hypothetical protein
VWGGVGVYLGGWVGTKMRERNARRRKSQNEIWGWCGMGVDACLRVR